MTDLALRGSDRQTASRVQGATGRRSAALLVAGLGLSFVLMFGSVGSASAAAQCPEGTVYFRMACITVGFPTSPTTAPTTVAPLISLPPITLPPVTLPPILTPSAPVVVPEAAQRLLDLANGERQQAGLGRLTMRDDLVAIALAHSQEMAQAGEIFHSVSFFTAAVKNVVNAVARGENVAYNGDIDNTHARLMNSPGHRANLMNPRFSIVGFAVVKAPDGRYFTTQNFIQPAGAPPVAAVAAPRAGPAAASRKVAAPNAAPAPTTPTTAALEPTTTAPPPVPVTEPIEEVRFETASSAISVPAGAAGGIPAPLGATAVVLLAGAMCACCIAARRLTD